MKLPKSISIKTFIGFLAVLGISLLSNAYLLLINHLPSQEKQEQITATATRIVDGDTFDTAENIRIRLAGADAPEYSKGCLSLEAKNRLETLILGKKLTLEPVQKDSFGRQVAYVFLNEVPLAKNTGDKWQETPGVAQGSSPVVSADGSVKAENASLFIDQALVEEGLATAMENSQKYDMQILNAQDSARAASRGIWSYACQPRADCLIKGNWRRDKETKIYHTPDCYNYNKIVVDEKAKDQWFCTEEEAQAAGFTKSKDCPK